MNLKNLFYYLSLLTGLVVTILMIAAFGPKIIGKFIEEGFSYLGEILKSFGSWYDNPTAFFFCYLAGYALIWMKSNWGPILIILASVLLAVFNLHHKDLILVFVLPVFSVGVLYLIYWYLHRRVHTHSNASA